MAGTLKALQVVMVLHGTPTDAVENCMLLTGIEAPACVAIKDDECVIIGFKPTFFNAGYAREALGDELMHCYGIDHATYQPPKISRPHKVEGCK